MQAAGEKRCCIFSEMFCILRHNANTVHFTARQDERDMKDLGKYLKEKREERNMGSHFVENESKRLYPKDKRRQISFSYLCAIERGTAKEIFPLKLKTLAEIYDESYLYLLYLAGYLPEDPNQPETEMERLIYDGLLDVGVLRRAAKMKKYAKLDAKTRGALRQAVRIAAVAAVQAILNED